MIQQTDGEGISKKNWALALTRSEQKQRCEVGVKISPEHYKQRASPSTMGYAARRRPSTRSQTAHPMPRRSPYPPVPGSRERKRQHETQRRNISVLGTNTHVQVSRKYSSVFCIEHGAHAAQGRASWIILLHRPRRRIDTAQHARVCLLRPRCTVVLR